MTQATATIFNVHDWDNTTRSNPALKWFEPVVRDIFDAHKWETPYSEIYTDDFHLLKPDGTEVHGGKDAWAEVAKLFDPFVEQRTQPLYIVTTETDYGYEMIANAYIFGNLPGQAGPNEPPKSCDVDGKEWDCKMSGGFRVQFVKDAGGPRESGMLLKSVQICADTAPVMVGLLRRGVVKVQDLGLA